MAYIRYKFSFFLVLCVFFCLQSEKSQASGGKDLNYVEIPPFIKVKDDIHILSSHITSNSIIDVDQGKTFSVLGPLLQSTKYSDYHVIKQGMGTISLGDYVNAGILLQNGNLDIMEDAIMDSHIITSDGEHNIAIAGRLDGNIYLDDGNNNIIILPSASISEHSVIRGRGDSGNMNVVMLGMDVGNEVFTLNGNNFDSINEIVLMGNNRYLLSNRIEQSIHLRDQTSLLLNSDAILEANVVIDDDASTKLEISGDLRNNIDISSSTKRNEVAINMDRARLNNYHIIVNREHENHLKLISDGAIMKLDQENVANRFNNFYSVELDGHFIMSEQALPQTLQSLAIMEDGIVLGDEHSSTLDLSNSNISRILLGRNSKVDGQLKLSDRSNVVDINGTLSSLLLGRGDNLLILREKGGILNSVMPSNSGVNVLELHNRDSIGVGGAAHFDRMSLYNSHIKLHDHMNYVNKIILRDHSSINMNGYNVDAVVVNESQRGLSIDGVSTIHQDYIQGVDGNIVVPADRNNDGVLHVGGDVSLDGTLTVTRSAGSDIHNAKRFLTFSGERTGTFSDFEIDNSMILSNVVYGDDSVILLLSDNYCTGFHCPYHQCKDEYADTQYSDQSAVRIGSIGDVDSTMVTSANARSSTARDFVFATSDGGVDGVTLNLLSEYRAFAYAGIEQSRIIGNIISDRIEESRTMDSDTALSWMQIYTDGDKNDIARSSASGLAIGVDGPVSDRISAGMLLSYGHTTINPRESHSTGGNSKYYQFALYSSMKYDDTSYFNGHFSFGLGANRSNMHIYDDGVQDSYSGNNNTSAVAARTTFIKEYNISSNTVIKPWVSLDYADGVSGAFNESGSSDDSVAFRVGEIKESSLLGGIGVKLNLFSELFDNTSTSFYVNCGYMMEMMSHKYDYFNVTDISSNQDDSVKALNMNKNVGVLEVAVQHHFLEMNGNLSLSHKVHIKGGGSSHYTAIGFNIPF